MYNVTVHHSNTAKWFSPLCLHEMDYNLAFYSIIPNEQIITLYTYRHLEVIQNPFQLYIAVSICIGLIDQ